MLNKQNLAETKAALFAELCIDPKFVQYQGLLAVEDLLTVEAPKSQRPRTTSQRNGSHMRLHSDNSVVTNPIVRDKIREVFLETINRLRDTGAKRSTAKYLSNTVKAAVNELKHGSHFNMRDTLGHDWLHENRISQIGQIYSWTAEPNVNKAA